ncbi:EPIDERMAL PATTERNING FACTOR-like protein 2 [Nymphaea thermarum]|nr:EPIDERMAL PATTERNING FACTOR-like protein 2 [Nymphaea thermarum]
MQKLLRFREYSSDIKLVPSTGQAAVYGRAVPKLLDSSKVMIPQGGSAEETSKIVYGRGVKAMIGSRPPRCQRRCASCAHCEAIQVPTTPQFKNGKQRTVVASISSIISDTSNYKPMSWKCKCGDFIYNP